MMVLLWAMMVCYIHCPHVDIIADSVEYMVNAHKADAMICISNCDKVTPGMLMASMRLNIPRYSVLEAQWKLVDGVAKMLILLLQ